MPYHHLTFVHRVSGSPRETELAKAEADAATGEVLIIVGSCVSFVEFFVLTASEGYEQLPPFLGYFLGFRLASFLLGA